MKHMKRKQKKLLNSIFLIIFFAIIILLEIQVYNKNILIKNQEIAKQKVTESNINKSEEKNNSETNNTKKSDENIPEQYYGYLVEAKLEIPTINLGTYVLGKYSAQSLKVSVTKFWGGDANEIGNYCIAGHNFKNKNMFYNLRKLKIGDEIYLTDTKSRKVKYKIYNIYQVLPEEVSCLSQRTNGNKEITLITCTYNSKKRIIVKAKEEKRV